MEALKDRGTLAVHKIGRIIEDPEAKIRVHQNGIN
jgi:hypothetical protein